MLPRLSRCTTSPETPALLSSAAASRVVRRSCAYRTGPATSSCISFFASGDAAAERFGSAVKDV